MKKETFKFSLLLFLLLFVIYAPRMKLEGGILFNVIQDITCVYGFPAWDNFTNHEFRRGFFPLWNPHNALGEPHLANMQSAVFYPLTWLKILTNVNFFAYDIILVFRLFLAGMFMWWFLEEFQLNFLSRAFGAISFALTGYFVRHVYMSHLNVEILLPLSMLVFGKAAKNKTKRYFILTVFVVWLTIVGGFPEATLYLLFLCSFWYLYRCESPRLIRLPFLIGALLLGGLASAPQSLPFLEYLHNSWTYHESGLGYGHLNYHHFWPLLIPWFFGENNVSVVEPFTPPYIGTAVSLLTIAGALGLNRKKIIFFTFFAIFMFGVIFGISPFIWIADIYPFSVTLNFKYAMPSFAFCASVLSAFGMKELLEGVFSKSLRLSLLLASFLILFAVYIFNEVSDIPWYYLTLNPFWIFVACGIIVLLALTSVVPVGKLKKIGGILLLFSSILPIYGAKGIVNKDFINTPTTMYGQFLAEHYKHARFGSDTTLLPNTNLSLMLNDIRYYNPMYVKRYTEIFARAETNTDTVPSCLFCVIGNNFRNYSFLQPSTENLNNPLWEKMGLSIWIGSAPGRKSILHSIIVDGDWQTSRHGMIARTKFGDSIPALFAHAPSQVAFFSYLEDESNKLIFIPIIDKRAQGKSDGVFFQIKISDEERYNFERKKYEEKVLFSRFLTPLEDFQKEVVIDIPDKWKNKAIKLIFITTAGTLGDTNSDWSAWGKPSLEFKELGKWRKLKDEIYARDIPFGYCEKENKIEPLGTTLTFPQKIEVECDYLDGRIILPYVYYPGWKAYNDEKKEIKIIPEEGALLSVEASRKVEFIYKPFSFKIGLWCFIVSFLWIPVFLFPKKQYEKDA